MFLSYTADTSASLFWQWLPWGESCPLLEPSASLPHACVLQSVVQLCDEMHSEKVVFSPLMYPRASSLISSYVFLLCILGQSRRCSVSSIPLCSHALLDVAFPVFLGAVQSIFPGDLPLFEYFLKHKCQALTFCASA